MSADLRGGERAGARVIAGLLVTLGVLGSGPALASDAAQSEALIRQGVNLRQQGQDERALPFFQKAYDLVHSPRTEGQLGLAEMAVGYWLDAEQHLAEAIDASDDAWVSKNRKPLVAALARVRGNIGEISVVGAPAGASISVNGRPAGTAPLATPLRVAKGKVDLEVRATGYRDVIRSVHVAGADRQEVAIALEKEEAPALPTAAAEPSAAGTSEAPAVDLRAAPSERPEHRVRRKVAWGFGIAAGLALAATVTETVIWQLKRADFDTHKAAPPDNPTLDPGSWRAACGSTEPNRGGDGCLALYDAAHSAQTYALIGYAVTGALAITSGVLFLTSRRRESTEARVACVPSLLTAAVSCRLSF
jgi:PEGA domain